MLPAHVVPCSAHCASQRWIGRSVAIAGASDSALADQFSRFRAAARSALPNGVSCPLPDSSGRLSLAYEIDATVDRGDHRRRPARVDVAQSFSQSHMVQLSDLRSLPAWEYKSAGAAIKARVGSRPVGACTLDVVVPRSPTVEALHGNPCSDP